MSERVVEFIRKKDFILKEELGQGACGRTVLLYDTLIDEHFVCKKYSPLNDGLKEKLFDNFIREVKLLHLLNHINVVRVFNYYLYPEQFLGYILMEFVRGTDIADYITKHPEDVNEIFLQVVEGFTHLEKNKILHRDIRPQNIMVSDGGTVKIIDFGFGKQAIHAEDFNKSISLNWWCEPPSEFREHIYDLQTEVYFIGKLFEQTIVVNGLEHFKHKVLLGRMCATLPANRIASFSDVRKELLSDKFLNIDFDESELEIYREFSRSIFGVASKIEQGARYHGNINDIQAKLEDCYKKVMLEEWLPNGTLVLNCFVNGPYYYNKNTSFPVFALKDFVDLFRKSSREKKNIIVSNLQTKLDSIKRYHEPEVDPGEIPF